MNSMNKVAEKLYILLLMAFTIWFGKFMYPLIFGFEGKEEAAVSIQEWGHVGTKDESPLLQLIVAGPEQRTTDLGYEVLEQPYIEGHFHHIGFVMEEDEADVCTRCHGSAPHHGSKELRSFLNMHAFFLACETCHVPPGKTEQVWGFRWYEKDTGAARGTPRALVEIDDISRKGLTRAEYPTYGNYGAKIAPDKGVEGEDERARDLAIAERYLAEQVSLSAQQKSQISRMIHRRLGESPVQCPDCHRESDPYLPLAELGYPPRRVSELTHAAVVGMIEKYKDFYLPGVLSKQAPETESVPTPEGAQVQ